MQTTEFITDLARVLTAGGAVIANVFNGSAEARASADIFAKRLHACMGSVYALPVCGRHTNRILLAFCAEHSAMHERGLREQLRQGYFDASRCVPSLEPPLVDCFRQNAETFHSWESTQPGGK
uniref:Uncharacterized protein n=1 Tax=Chrysotila carterae TaxID=13221 RepID=A0A7S4C1D6_CHRCT